MDDHIKVNITISFTKRFKHNFEVPSRVKEFCMKIVKDPMYFARALNCIFNTGNMTSKNIYSIVATYMYMNALMQLVYFIYIYMKEIVQLT